jgi:hypothetical protein
LQETHLIHVGRTGCKVSVAPSETAGRHTLPTVTHEARARYLRKTAFRNMPPSRGRGQKKWLSACAQGDSYDIIFYNVEQILPPPTLRHDLSLTFRVLKAIAVAAFGHVPVASINKTGWISPVDFELLLKEPP